MMLSIFYALFPCVFFVFYLGILFLTICLFKSIIKPLKGD